MCRRSAGSPLASSLLMLLLPLFMCCLGSVPSPYLFLFHQRSVIIVDSIVTFTHLIFTSQFRIYLSYSDFVPILRLWLLLCSSTTSCLFPLVFHPYLSHLSLILMFYQHLPYLPVSLCLSPTFPPSHLTLNFKPRSLCLPPIYHCLSRAIDSGVDLC